MAKKRFNNRPPMPPVPPIPPAPPTPIPPDKPHFHFPHRHWKPNNHRADFAPMLLHPHIPHHFDFWCNKIIPLAYDDSLSYYEVLAKTTDYLNNMLNDEKMLAINVEELAQCFCELQHFVNDYFSFYQSKGLIVYDFAITSENYEKFLPDADTAQMNTLYRVKFVEGAEQNITANLPENAKPYSGAECLLFNVSNFDLRRYGNQWQEVTPDEKEYSTKNNYQLFITDKDIFFRENNGDSWGEWNSIFANWWETAYVEVQNYVQEVVNGIVDDLTALIEAETTRATAAETALGDRITAETTRATAAETALDDRITAETTRATAAENALSSRLVAEYERAAAAEQALDDKIDDEISRATTAEQTLSNTLTIETTRATTAENNLSAAITAETSRATTAENALSAAITAETSRATGAENALSGRIADWETDLAQEVTERRQGDTANANAISAEATRATAAEQANASAISAETTRATAAEQAIRGEYIPNDGNDLSSDNTSTFDLSRYNDVSISSTDGNIKFICDTLYYNPSSTPQASEEVATKGDITAATTGIATQSWVTTQLSGYIPNSGNNIHENFTLNRADFQLKGYGFKTGISIHREKVTLQGYGTDTFIDVGRDTVNTDDIYIHANNKLNVRSKNELYLVTETNHCCYYLKNWTSGGTITADMEIATKGDLSSYIPNAGNDLSSVSGSQLDITRDDNVNLKSIGGNIELYSAYSPSSPVFYADGDGVLIEGANAQLDVGYSNNFINAWAQDEITFKVGDSNNKKAYLTLTDGSGVAINGQGDTVTISDSDTVEINGGDYVRVYGDNISLSATSQISLQSGDVTVTGNFTVYPIESGGESLFKISGEHSGNAFDYTTFGYNILDKKGNFQIIVDSGYFTDLVAFWHNVCSATNATGEVIAKGSFSLGSGTYTFNSTSKTKMVFDGVVFTNMSGAVLNLTQGDFVFRNCRFSTTQASTINVSNSANADFVNCHFANDITINVSSHSNNNICNMQGCAFGILNIDGAQTNTERNIIVRDCYADSVTITPDQTGINITNVMICNNRIIALTVGTGSTLSNAYSFNNQTGTV